MRQPKVRCVIYRTTSIGDVILATSTLSVLQKLEIDFEVHWIGRNPSLELLRASYPDQHFYEISNDEGSKKVFDELCKLEHIHFIVDLQKSLRSKRFCTKLSGYHDAPVYTWDKKSVFRAKLILNASIRGRSKPAREEVYQPSFYQYSQMAAPMLEAVRDIYPDLNFDPVRQNQARPTLSFEHLVEKNEAVWLNELRVGRWLALAPGASYESKRAPTEFFVSVMQKLKEKMAAEHIEAGIVYMGSQEDRAFALSIIDAVDWPYPSLNLCGKLSLLESAFGLSLVKGILSNDSSLGHICEALGHPSSVIYGPTAEGFGFAPWRDDSAAHSADLACRPCSKHGQKSCRFNDLRCYKDIDQSKVVDHLFSMLASSS